MDHSVESIKCLMDAIDHGRSRDEALDECPTCAEGLSISESLRHDNFGWHMPTALSEMV